jgi:hypothetical protein
MLGVFVTFRYESSFDTAKVRKIAEGARTMLEGMPGLVERVTGLYGVRPTIQFVEIATLVDNGGG